MSKSRRSIVTRLTLIALLLWGQSAVAQHELGHFWHDSTELCQVFSSADSAKVALADTMILICQPVYEKLNPLNPTSPIERALTKPFARGPPINNLI